MPTVLGTTAIAGNVTNLDFGSTVQGLGAVKSVSLIAEFVYGSGGAANGVTVRIQTSYDGNVWYDVAAFGFSQAAAKKSLTIRADTGISAAQTLVTGQLAADTAIQGVLGDRLKAVLWTTGAAYAGPTEVKILMQER